MESCTCRRCRLLFTDWSALYAQFDSSAAPDEVIKNVWSDDFWMYRVGEHFSEQTAFNTGFACSNIVAIDVDISISSNTVNRVRRMADEHLGEEPLIRVGRWPRVMLIYRLKEPFGYKRLTVSIGGETQDIEILGNGRQFTGFGIHPKSGKPYTWLGGRTPLNTHVDHLPGVDCDDIRLFGEAVADEFGGLVDKRQGVGGEGGSAALVYTEGLISDGRETYLRDMTFRLVREAADELTEKQLCAEADKKFCKTAVIDGRWTNASFRLSSIRGKVKGAIKKLQKQEHENAQVAAQRDDIPAEMFSWVDLTRGASNLNDNVLEVGDIEGVVWKLDGTAAETTLAWKFGIHRPDAGWPDVLGWHEGKGALVLKLDHEATPSALYVCFGAGVHSGSNLNDLTIERAGAFDAEFCKLPGNGRVIVCEGAIPALSVWVATGRAVWLSVQEPVAVTDSIPDGAILALDERPYRWNTLNDADKRKSIKGRLDALRRAGRKLVHIHPQPYRKHDYSTFADLYLFAGPEAIRERIAFADSVADGTAQPSEARSKEEARAELGGDMAGWCDDLKDGTAPAAMLLLSQAGAGKTEAFVRNVPPTTQALKDKLKSSNPNILISVANHENSSEVTERLKAAAGDDIRVRVFRGRDQTDPETGKLMCRDKQSVDKATSELRNVEKEVCGPCKFKAECGYQKQLNTKGDIWLPPHTLLTINSVPRCFGSIQGIVVDEDPTSDWVDKKSFPLEKLADPDIPAPIGPAGVELRKYRDDAFQFINSNGTGPVSRDALREVFNVSKAERALWLERLRKLSTPDPDNLSNLMGTGLEAALFGTSWADNTTFKGFELFWQTILDIVSEEGGKAGRLSITEDTVEVGGEQVQMRFIEVRKRTGIANAWLYPNGREKQVPVLFTDATPTELVLRDFHPDLIVKDTGRIEAPHAKTYQDATRRYSKAMLAPNGGPANKAAKRQQSRLEVGAKAYETVLVRGGEGLITTNKDVREAMENELPGVKGRYQFAHLNNVRGKDTFKHVTTQFDIGRTDPGKRVFEQEAGAITRTMPESSEGDCYAITDAILFTPDGPVMDHNQNFNIDPLVQALHDRTIRSESIQAQARPRPIDRMADNSVSIYAFNDTVYETEVELLEDEWNPHPVFMSLAKHGLAVTNNATRASATFPDLFETPRAYQYAEENASFGPEMAEFCGKSQIIPKTGSSHVTGIYITIPTALELRLFGIIQPGQGQKPFHVLVDTLAHEGRDPLDVIRERFGADVAIAEIKIDPNTGQPVEDSDQDAIREQVKSLMKARKVSQAALAEVIGVKQAKVSKWLKGEQDLKADALVSLIEWMGAEATQTPQEEQKMPVAASATVTARANVVAMPSARPVSRSIEVSASATINPFQPKQEQTAPTWSLKAEAQDQVFSGGPGAYWLKTSSAPWLENTNPFAHMFDLNKAPILPTSNEDGFNVKLNLNEAPILEELKVQYGEKDFYLCETG